MKRKKSKHVYKPPRTWFGAETLPPPGPHDHEIPPWNVPADDPGKAARAVAAVSGPRDGELPDEPMLSDLINLCYVSCAKFGKGRDSKHAILANALADTGPVWHWFTAPVRIKGIYYEPPLRALAFPYRPGGQRFTIAVVRPEWALPAWGPKHPGLAHDYSDAIPLESQYAALVRMANKERQGQFSFYAHHKRVRELSHQKVDYRPTSPDGRPVAKITMHCNHKGKVVPNWEAPTRIDLVKDPDEEWIRSDFSGSSSCPSAF